MKDKELLNDMHRLLSNADSNNLKWIISKLSENTINKINAYCKDQELRHDFNINKTERI